jgi:GTPase SAR1 family protein
MSMNNNSDNPLVFNTNNATSPSNILLHLSPEEQVRVSRTSKSLYSNLHRFWETHPLNPIWKGEPIVLKVVFCKIGKITWNVSCLYMPQINQIPYIGSTYGLLIRGNIKYDIWDASFKEIRSTFPLYIKNAHISVLCYEKTEDLAQVAELYDIVHTNQLNTKIILVCTNSKGICQKQLAAFLTGKSILRCCNFVNSIQLQNEMNSVGFQIATEQNIAKERAQQKASTENTEQQSKGLCLVM